MLGHGYSQMRSRALLFSNNKSFDSYFLDMSKNNATFVRK